MTTGLACLLAIALLASQPASAAEPYETVVAAVHVHSTVSTGDMTIGQLATRAETLGLDALLLTENFSLRYEYGLFPLRTLRYTVSFPSVVEYGHTRYLDEVAAEQTRHPRVLLIPGIETGPHYYWTGGLLQRELTMHNSQKNMLLFGSSPAADFQTLPVNGNPNAAASAWDVAATVVPVALLAPAAWLWRRQSSRAPMRSRLAAIGLLVLALALVAATWPPVRPPFSPYEPLGAQPYQTLIDEARENGDVTIWSMPEASDFHQYERGPVSVTIKTDPYPEALLETTGYTAFGGVYQDHRRVQKPGGVWDRALSEYVAGRRPEPVFTVGENAFHSLQHAGKDLDQVLTVFWARTRTISDLLDAARAGRAYAVLQTGPFGLRLDAFRFDCGPGCAAISGETARPQSDAQGTVTVAISATDHGAHPIDVAIIRSGTVLATVRGTTPFVEQFVDPARPLAPTYYRVEVTGPGEILSNPIFLQPR